MSARILLIDDETNIRTMMKVALQHSGYTVEAAVDGVEGLEKYGDGSGFDVVLLDQRMPHLPGIEVQREIMARNPDARVILITAFGTMDLALDAVRAGAHDFLRKPFTADVLRAAVQAALARDACAADSAPVNAVCKAFLRSSINGYSFEFAGEATPPGSADQIYRYVVHSPLEATPVSVHLPAYVQELARAYADTEDFPGGDRFWQALAEECLAAYLWNEAEPPEGGELRVDDLTPDLRKWLDSVLTVPLVAA